MLNPTSFALRPFAAPDIRASHALSQAVGWAHRPEDWDLLLRVGRGQVAVDEAGRVRGVAMWWPQGQDFATLGMVIVAPELQRAGIGRRLVTKVLEDIGSRRVQLIATREGGRLYESLGFRTTSEIVSCSGVVAAGAGPVITDGTVRSLTAKDHAAILAIDFRASGADRSDMLAALLPVSTGFAVERNGVLSGYALCRDFGRGRVVGPIVADDEDLALSLLSGAMINAGGFIRTDVPSDAVQLITWLEQAGLQPAGAVQVMQRGQVASMIRGPRIFAIAAQALG